LFEICHLNFCTPPLHQWSGMAGVGLELCAGNEGDWIVSYIEEGYGADASKAILRGDKVCLPVSLARSNAHRHMAEEDVAHEVQRGHTFSTITHSINPSSRGGIPHPGSCSGMINSSLHPCC
jgi:hypothetical protein